MKMTFAKVAALHCRKKKIESQKILEIYDEDTWENVVEY